MEIVYIAGPYRGRDYNEVADNIRRAEKAAIALWDAGYAVLCPHLNAAHFEYKSTAPSEAYLEAGLRFLEACDLVLVLPGSAMSAGACAEVSRAHELGIPMSYGIDMLLNRISQPPRASR